MSRRSPNDMPMIACRFDEPTMKRLKVISGVLGVPLAQVIRELVDHGLDGWPERRAQAARTALTRHLATECA